MLFKIPFQLPVLKRRPQTLQIKKDILQEMSLSNLQWIQISVEQKYKTEFFPNQFGQVIASQRKSQKTSQRRTHER